MGTIGSRCPIILWFLFFSFLNVSFVDNLLCILLYSMIPFIERSSCYISCTRNVLRAPYRPRFMCALCPDWDVKKYIFATSPSSFGRPERWIRKVIYNMYMSINERLSLQWPKQQKRKMKKKSMNKKIWIIMVYFGSPPISKQLCELCNKSYPMVQCIHS